MKFIKLHQDGRELLVNMSNVSDVYITKDGESLVYLNIVVDNRQVNLKVDESLAEILELITGT